MKSDVCFSPLSWVVTSVVTVILVAGAIFSVDRPGVFVLLSVIIVTLYVISLIYSPMSVEVDENEININSSFKIHTIHMREVASVERYRLLPCTVRICGSGGFMGYWGTFRDSVSGRYFCYRGNADDCFMVTLASGRKYLLGCKNPDAMVGYIRSRIERQV